MLAVTPCVRSQTAWSVHSIVLALFLALTLLAAWAPPVMAQSGVEISVKGGFPTQIPADGEATTVLTVDIQPVGTMAELLERVMNDRSVQLSLIVYAEPRSMATMSPSFTTFDLAPFQQEVTLKAGKTAGTLSVTALVNLVDAGGVTPVKGAPEAKMKVQFVLTSADGSEPQPQPEPAAAEGEPAVEPKPPEARPVGPRALRQDMAEQVRGVLRDWVRSRGARPPQVETMPGWSRLNDRQQAALTEIVHRMARMYREETGLP